MFREVSELAAKATDPKLLSMVGISVATAIAVYTVVTPFLKTDKLTARMKAVSSDREELKKRSRLLLHKDSGTTTQLRHVEKGPWKRLVQMLNLKKLLEDPNVEAKLLQAGFRGAQPLSVFYFARFSLPIVFFIFALLYMIFSGSKMEGTQRLLVGIGACAVGFYAPNLYIGNVAQKRQQSIKRAFPDALDLLLICVESGMSIESAFQRVSEEIGTSSIELAEELGLTTAELAYLQDRRSAYENLAKRTNHPGIKAVSMALQQAEKYGTPLGAALRVMAKENRELRMTEAEKKAAALPAQLTVPMIVFFLPVLFIVILTPAYIKWQNMSGRDQQLKHADGKASTKPGAKGPSQGAAPPPTGAR